MNNPARKSLGFFLASLLSIALISVGCSQPLDSSQSPSRDSSDFTVDWTSRDIGSPSKKGFVSEDEDGQIVVVAGGSDVWGASDSFHYVYQELDGNGSLTVKVNEMDAVDKWTKVGLMIRESDNPTARNAFLLITDSNGIIYQRREQPGASTVDVGPDGSHVQDFGASAPWWLKVERVDNELIARHSADGNSWRELGRVHIELPDEVLIGMAVTSRNPEATARAAFSQIELSSVTEQEPTPSDPDPEPTPPPPSQNPGPTNEATYQIDSDTDFLNPERGFHASVNLLTGAGINQLRPAGYTLGRAVVRLDDYRYQAIPQTILNQLRGGFQSAREAGVKIVVRFNYNHGREADAPLESVLMHIEQLAPILSEYEDVIATMHAGFIGAWGEWHASTNGLLEDSKKREITDALLAALPETRMLQIRTPAHIRSLVGSPSPSVEPFSGTPEARLGFLNDCFVANSNDAGTYANDQDRREAATLSKYTVTGGETCQVSYPNARNSCEHAMVDLALYNWDYLNAAFHLGVLDRWRAEGCYEDVSRLLGYRFGLTKAAVTQSVSVGESITLTTTVVNQGFGKLYNPRPVNILLRNQETGEMHTLRAANDARQIFPLSGESQDIEFTVVIPTNVTSGAYDVLLQLPDAADSLANDTRYNVRFANVGTWDEAIGANNLLLTTSISR